MPTSAISPDMSKRTCPIGTSASLKIQVRVASEARRRSSQAT
jgi:hypothetical protein